MVLTLPDLADRKAAERLLTGWWKKICGEILRRCWSSGTPGLPGGTSQADAAHPADDQPVGSCQPATAVITMNERLLHAPMECTEYIMVHELAHFAGGSFPGVPRGGDRGDAGLEGTQKAAAGGEDPAISRIKQ